jgi:hypothetical protein
MDFLPDCGPSCGGNQGQAIVQGGDQMEKVPKDPGGGEGEGGEGRICF